MKNQTDDFSDFESRLIASGNSPKIGKLNDQRFYAVRYRGGRLSIPFARKKFSALINAVSDYPETELRKIGMQLLKHGLAQAVCIGNGAEQVSEIFDELIDDHSFTFDGFTPYTQVEEGALSDAVEFFTLPTGLTKVSLILTLGNENSHNNIVDIMNGFSALEDFDESEDEEVDDEGLDLIGVVETEVETIGV